MLSYQRLSVLSTIGRKSGPDRSAWAEVLQAVFAEHWIGQQGFTTTPVIQDLHAALQVGPGARVLEIGCGGGELAIRLAQQTGCHVTGIDRSEERIRGAQVAAVSAGLVDQTEFIAGRMLTAPFVAQSFDAIVSCDAFMRVPNKARLFATCWWLLRPMGRLACTLIVDRGAPADSLDDRIPGLPLLPTVHDYRTFALLAGFQSLEISYNSKSLREVSARWRGALAVWETELRAEFGQQRFQDLQKSTGQTAIWATQGFIDHVQMLAVR